jgi:hypothetical protein
MAALAGTANGPSIGRIDSAKSMGASKKSMAVGCFRKEIVFIPRGQATRAQLEN